MTMNLPAVVAVPAKSATLLGKLAEFVLALARKLSTIASRRMTCLALHRMDDYMLRDIGISRCDIDRLCHRVTPPDASSPGRRG